MTKDLLNLTIVIAILLVVGLGCSQLPITTTQQTQQSPPPAATPAQTPDEANEKLLEKLAELEKKIDDQQKQAKATPPPVIRTATTAWVNSPGDGFLALRSDPSADVGYRILQIPHGAEVRVISCQDRSIRIGGRSGRWCRVRYDGTTGWAFDGWLVY
ncbi:MAG: SH3 domain-containing protein [Acidobacteriota bacterium]|nr:MAG: SH3 domain-containing protein [Acidobacteriota bacterium]